MMEFDPLLKRLCEAYPQTTPFDKLTRVLEKIANGEIELRYSPDQARDPKGQWTAGGVTLTASKERAFKGMRENIKNKLDKTPKGRLGEQIAAAYMKSLGVKDVVPANAAQKNYPIDLVGGKQAIEVKTGSIDVAKASQQFRATIGAPGKAEKAAMRAMTKAQIKAHNAGKKAQIMVRKARALEETRQKFGRSVRPTTVAVLLNHDKQIADVYHFEGYHHRIGYTSAEATAGYVGSFKYKAKK